MLPTIMSQMGMSTEGALGGESGRRKFAARGDQPSGNEQSGTTNEQAGADDEDVPGMPVNAECLTVERLSLSKIWWKTLTKPQTPSDRPTVFIIINEQHFKRVTVVFCHFSCFFSLKKTTQIQEKEIKISLKK